MKASWVITPRPCTNCGRRADRLSVAAVLHENDEGQFLGLYCTDPQCSAAESRAWAAITG